MFLITYAMFNVQSVCLSSLEGQLLLILSIFIRHRYTQSLLRFYLIRFPLLSQQKLFYFVIYLALLLYFH